MQERTGLITETCYRSDMNITCSFFTHAEDALPKPWAGRWPSLLELLSKTNEPRNRAKGDNPKKGLPAIAGALFSPLHRGKAEAQSLQLLGLDYDNGVDEVIKDEFHPSGRPKTRKALIDNPVTMEEVTEALQKSHALAYQWSTWSNRHDWPKHRAIVALAHPVPAGLWHPATEWALRDLGLEDTRRGLDLAALRDVARMYFLPGHPEGADAIRRGEVFGCALAIPLDQLAAADLPAAVALRHTQVERNVRKSEGYRWAARLQVDLSTLRLAELIADLGVQVKPAGPYLGGNRWRTHCLWPAEHTDGQDDDSAFVIHEPGRWPTWSCSHACHLHLGLQDVLRAAGVI